MRLKSNSILISKTLTYLKKLISIVFIQVENTLENSKCQIDSAHEINNYNRPDTANSSDQTITQEEDPLNANYTENAQEEIKNVNKVENLEEGDFHMDEDTLEIDETNLEILDEVEPTPNSTKDQSKTPSVPVYTKVPEKAAKSKNGLRKSRRFTVLLDFEEQNALNSCKKNSLLNSNHDSIHSSPIDNNNTPNSSKSLKKYFILWIIDFTAKFMQYSVILAPRKIAPLQGCI